LRFPNEIVASALLCRETFFLARTAKHSVYDMFYIALAQREGATLFTRDKALKKLAQSYDIDVA
jgi:predicted nucleic acid-binding protein